MRKRYIKPTIEVFAYMPEEGYAATQVYLNRDYVLVEGADRETLRSADEVTEYTDASGEYDVGVWE